MNQDTQLANALQNAVALANVPIRPDIADQGDAPPYVVFSEIAMQQGVYTLCGESSLVPARYQIDAYAATRQQANAIGAIVIVTLANRFEAVLLNRQSLFEPDTRLRRVMLDVSIWFEQAL